MILESGLVKLVCKSENNDKMFMSMLFFVIVIFGRKEKKALSVTIVSCVFIFRGIALLTLG